ncbi:MAG TPA: ABC transporter substrate-binding protein, partial [Candidatus Binatia bacterium]|nr:ABC transporter substrate-binding protein [Candidatus Binatia bacterium]
MKLNGLLRIGYLKAAICLSTAVIFSHAAALDAQSQPVTVGVLTPGLHYESVFNGLREGLEKLGYRENREVKFIVEDTRGSLDVLAERAANLVGARPDVLVTVATASAVAAKQATQAIPIVFTVVGDPVRSGLVAAFGASRNNLTGVSFFAAQLSGKRLELLREIAPQAKKVLAVVPIKEASGRISFEYLEESAKKLSLQIVRRDVTTSDEMENLLKTKWADTVDAVFNVPSVLVVSLMESIVEKATKERLPLISFEQMHVQMGALASYSGGFRESGIQAAKLVFKILRGA